MAKDYLAIARQAIKQPSAQARMPRFLVYGRNKKGKTRFCTTAPDVLIVDPEGGTAEETRADPDIWPLTRWEDIDNIYGALKSGLTSPKTGRPYKWVSLDGSTRMLSMALNYIRAIELQSDLTRKPTDARIQDWGKANKLWETALHNFHNLRDIGIIITAQERMIEISNMEDLGDDEEATPAGYMYVPDLPKGARSPLNQIVDVIGRIYVVRGDFTRTRRYRKGGKVFEEEVPVKSERRLYIGAHEMYDTGYRSGYELPDFIRNPTVPSLVRAMREGKVSA